MLHLRKTKIALILNGHCQRRKQKWTMMEMTKRRIHQLQKYYKVGNVLLLLLSHIIFVYKNVIATHCSSLQFYHKVLTMITTMIHSFNNLSKITEELTLTKSNSQINCYKHAN